MIFNTASRRALFVSQRTAQSSIERQFSAAAIRRAEAATFSAKRPVGGIRGGIFGFLLGSTLTGFFGYYYVLDMYRESNALLLQDLLELQRHVTSVEDSLKVSKN
ncbi:hypothetical protein V1511DRAFT_498375 [Dipodascopsis uninucleata]